MYALLTCAGKISEVPLLFDTSFNTAGQPIVESFEDAPATFLLVNGIDSVLLNDYRVVRRDALCLSALRLTKLRMGSTVSMSTRVGPSSLNTVILLVDLNRVVAVCLAPAQWPERSTPGLSPS